MLDSKLAFSERIFGDYYNRQQDAKKKYSSLSKCYHGRLSGSPVSAKIPAGYFNTDLIALGTVGDGVSFPSDRIN